MLPPPFNPNAAGNLRLVPVLAASVAVWQGQRQTHEAHGSGKSLGEEQWARKRLLRAGLDRI